MASLKSVTVAVGSGARKVGSVTKNTTSKVVNFDVHAPKLPRRNRDNNRAARVAASQVTVKA